MCRLKSTHNLFSNFLNKSNGLVMKKLFVSTQVLLNDLHFLNFVKLFVDGIYAIVRASRNQKITKKDVKALKIVHE